MQIMECEESLMKLLKYLYEKEIVVECKGKDKGRGEIFFSAKFVNDLL